MDTKIRIMILSRRSGRQIVSVFSTDLIRSSKELNLMSDIRADYSGILDMIYTDYEGSTEELFLIECDQEDPDYKCLHPWLGWIRHNGIQHSHYNTLDPGEYPIKQS